MNTFNTTHTSNPYSSNSTGASTQNSSNTSHSSTNNTGPTFNTTNNREIEIGTANIIDIAKKKLQEIANWFTSKYYGPQSSKNDHLTPEQQKKIRKITQDRLSLVFYDKLEKTLECIEEHGLNGKRKKQAISLIIDYLKNPLIEIFFKEFEYEKIDKLLVDYLPPQTYQDLTEGLAFYERLEVKLDLVKKNGWSDTIKQELIELITDYFKSPALQTHQNIDREMIDTRLGNNLPSKAYLELKNRIGFNQKRNIQQMPSFIISDKIYLSDPTEAKWDRISLCIHGNSGMIAGATINDPNATHPNEQRVLLFNINNHAVSKINAVSSAISAAFPPRQGQNNIAMACGNGYFHITTEDPTQGIYHSVIQNQTLTIPQYLAAPYAANNGSLSGRSWNPAKLVDNQAVFGLAYNNSWFFYQKYTNLSSGMFDSSIVSLQGVTNGLPPNAHQEIVSFIDGSFIDVQDYDTSDPRLYIGYYNSSRYNFKGQNDLPVNLPVGQQISKRLYGPRTPVSKNYSVPFLSYANQSNSAALFDFMPNQETLNFNRILTPNSGIGSEGRLSVANCADLPEISAYARDAFDTGRKYVIMFDVMNATLNSSSIIGGEQIYNNFTLTSPAQPQIGCFSNGTILIAYLENGLPVSFTFNFLGFNPPTPTPSPSSSNNVSINVTIPSDLGTNFTPITTQIITFSNNTATIEVIDTKGFKIVYTINGSDVPLFTKFTPEEIYNFSIARGNATDGSAPIFVACNTGGGCAESTAKNPIHTLFETNDVNLALVIPLIILGVAAVCIPGGIWYYKVEMPRSKKRRDRYYDTSEKAKEESY